MTDVTGITRTAADDVLSLLDRLPKDASLEDIQYHLYVLQKIQCSEARAAAEGWVSNEEARKRLGRWLDE